jgi:Tfp pilus assembly protein PilX
MDRKQFAKDLEKRTRKFAVKIIRFLNLGILDHFRHFFTRHLSQSGIAYMAILVLLAILATMGLAFIYKVGIMSSVTLNRRTGMQAQYLAESAANHALWRLLNDPEFTPASDTYYMHSLGDGRYGYKVRKPTETTFATVATVGAIKDMVSNQSYVQYLKPYNIITAYGQVGVVIPKNRRLLGAQWLDAVDTVNIGGDVHWMVLQGCPQRNEMIMGTLDEVNDINFAVWDGTSWGNLIEFTTTSNERYKCFDIAYENLSGDALVVGRYAASGDVRYNIWDGNAWVFGSAQIDANLTPPSSLTYIDMASRPNSDEILIAQAQFAKSLKVVQWDGSSFIDHGEIDTDLENNEFGGAEIVYEQQSGDALILWGHTREHQVYYAVWSGASLSPVPLLLPFDFGNDPRVIRAAADPTSDYIFIAAADDKNDLNVAVWNGDAWIDSLELEVSNYTIDEQIFDIAWEHSGEEVIIAWAPGSGNNVHYFAWRKGTALSDSAVKNGPNFQSSPYLVRLLPIAGTEKIVLLAMNASEELRYSLWTGNALLGDPAVLLESAIEGAYVTFDIVESGVIYTGGPG